MAIVIVVRPLIALMKEQVHTLRTKGVSAVRVRDSQGDSLLRDSIFEGKFSIFEGKFSPEELLTDLQW